MCLSVFNIPDVAMNLQLDFCQDLDLFPDFLHCFSGMETWPLKQRYKMLPVWPHVLSCIQHVHNYKTKVIIKVSCGVVLCTNKDFVYIM